MPLTGAETSALCWSGLTAPDQQSATGGFPASSRMHVASHNRHYLGSEIVDLDGPWKL